LAIKEASEGRGHERGEAIRSSGPTARADAAANRDFVVASAE
jgi:hypothetical protein